MTSSESSPRWPEGPARVLVADDDAATRIGVRAALQRGGMLVCAEAADADHAVAAAERERPDACLLEIVIPGDGIAAAERIAATVPGTTIVMLTESASERHLLAALAAGARGYLLKDTNPDRLPAAIDGALRGEAAIPRTLVPHLVDALAHRRRPPANRSARGALTEREHDVLGALAAGRTTRQVAEWLGLAEPTVRRHASSAAEKLGAATRAEAIARFRCGGPPPQN